MNAFLQQPIVVGWLLVAVAFTTSVVAVCSVLIVGILLVAGKQLTERASFSDQMQPLLDSGDLGTLIERCRARLKLFSDDASAHYLLGTALHRKGDLRQALPHLRRALELQAGWDVQPTIDAVETKLAASEERPGLTVVKATTDEVRPQS
jgi:tetratricopeptide (TPR) repeat protein